MQLGPLCRGVSEEPVTWEDAWKQPEERKVWWEEGDRTSLAKSKLLSLSLMVMLLYYPWAL